VVFFNPRLFLTTAVSCGHQFSFYILTGVCSSRTHVQKLTESTKRPLLKRGFTEADIPEKAVTMGVKTLTEARYILLLAAGEEKAAAVYQMLYARTTSYVPASYLQIPLNVTVLLDQAAAKMIV
jgi:glucosamine-6-phosphate deaminase